MEVAAYDEVFNYLATQANSPSSWITSALTLSPEALTAFTITLQRTCIELTGKLRQTGGKMRSEVVGNLALIKVCTWAT